MHRVEDSCLKVFIPSSLAPQVGLILSIGVIVGGIFLLFAAYRSFPSGINAISHLGSVGHGLGYGVIGLGSLTAALSLIFCCRRRPQTIPDTAVANTPLKETWESL